jgi:hypothetical protein
MRTSEQLEYLFVFLTRQVSCDYGSEEQNYAAGTDKGTWCKCLLNQIEPRPLTKPPSSGPSGAGVTRKLVHA